MSQPNKPAKQTTALAKPISEAKLAALREDFPTEVGFERILLPRIAFKSQDVTEGKGKAMKVIMEGGTFLEERQGEEEDPETGKKPWTSEELGQEIEGVIVFQRKQLRYFDESGSVTSSPIYDNDEEVIPLFADKAEIDRGTPAELKAKYPGVTQKGKPKSLLEDNRILYVLKDGELFQMSLRGSSMYSYMTYARKVRPAVPAVLTVFNSEPKENGSVAWNQMTFLAKRPLSEKEADEVLEKQQELKDSISAEKAFYAAQQPAEKDPLADEFSKR